MKLRSTCFDTAVLIEQDRHVDERGYFARTWCKREFGRHGLCTDLVQCNTSFNPRVGTLRGMHFQASPGQEAKLVRCTRGRIYDVIVDVRIDSQTFGRWQAFELSEDSPLSLYIPEGFAHGFQTLAPDSEVFYQMTEYHTSHLARTFHHADPQVAISWPLAVAVVSENDQRSGSLRSLFDAPAAPGRNPRGLAIR